MENERMKPCICLLQTLGADVFDESLSEESPHPEEEKSGSYKEFY